MSNSISPVLKALATARRKLINEIEEPSSGATTKIDYSWPVSARNEAAALAWLLEHTDRE